MIIQYIEKTSSQKGSQKLEVGVYKILLEFSKDDQQAKQPFINIDVLHIEKWHQEGKDRYKDLILE